MSVNLIKTLGFIIIVTCILLIYNYAGSNAQPYIKKIRDSYSGKIEDKYVERIPRMKVQTEKGVIIEAFLTDSLYNYAAIGDSIIKIPDDNYVYLIKHGRSLKIQYLYIPEQVYNDSQWPQEWKGKWIINDQ